MEIEEQQAALLESERRELKLKNEIGRKDDDIKVQNCLVSFKPIGLFFACMHHLSSKLSRDNIILLP